ncbi:hypothetical protein Tco_0825341 [Tanacetum coccineum]
MVLCSAKKDTTEFRPCGGSSSNRGGRSGTDRYARRSSSTHYSSSESRGVYGKPAYKRKMGRVLIHLQPHQLLELHHVLQNEIRQLTVSGLETNYGIEKVAITHVPCGILENVRIENDEQDQAASWLYDT